MGQVVVGIKHTVEVSDLVSRSQKMLGPAWLCVGGKILGSVGCHAGEAWGVLPFRQHLTTCLFVPPGYQCLGCRTRADNEQGREEGNECGMERDCVWL